MAEVSRATAAKNLDTNMVVSVTFCANFGFMTLFGELWTYVLIYILILTSN
jgi:hypothetical protein